jgi:hypothetical protein
VGIRRLALPALEIPGLFEKKKIIIPVGNRRPSDDIVVLRKTVTPNPSSTPAASGTATANLPFAYMSVASPPDSPANLPTKFPPVSYQLSAAWFTLSSMTHGTDRHAGRV